MFPYLIDDRYFCMRIYRRFCPCSSPFVPVVAAHTRTLELLRAERWTRFVDMTPGKNPVAGNIGKKKNKGTSLYVLAQGQERKYRKDALQHRVLKLAVIVTIR